MSDSVGSPDFLRTTEQARALRKSMSDAYAGLQSAHANYEQALAVAADTEHLSPDGFVILRQRGREYASAVMQYSRAVMAWLTFADTSMEQATRFIATSLTQAASAVPAADEGPKANSWQSSLDRLRVDAEIHGDMLLAVITGTISFDAALGVVKLVVDRAVDNKTERILVYSLGVHGELPISEKYRFFAEVAAYAVRQKPDLKLAFVAAQPLDGFAVTAARHHGANIQLFSTREDAIKWLDAVR